MDMKLNYKNENHPRVFYPAANNKKGVSTVIITVIMIALVMVIGTVVWAVVNNLIKGQTKGIESCFGVFDKVTINEMYTCYNDSNPLNNKTQFSIGIGDIDVEKVIVAISSIGETKSYTLTNENQTISGLGPYPSGTGTVKLPSKNGGLTYIASGFTSKPDLIKIAPVIKGKQCEASDELLQIENC